MKHKFLYILIGLITLVHFGACMNVCAQNVVKQGKTFVEQQPDSIKSNAKKTEYTYQDKRGNVYPIYLSSRGNAFILMTSKKTGKEYRKYLPEITKQMKSYVD